LNDKYILLYYRDTNTPINSEGEAMNLRYQKHHTFCDRQGFTLVELLVVMAIIALLAALVAPKVFPKLGQGKTSATKAQIELLGQALDQYRLDIGHYPTTEQGLQALITNPGEDKWQGPYLKKNLIPPDPWGKPYNYVIPGNHNNEYDLFSYGRDGTPGGEGEDKDVVNWE
jgi:general secretion pathway protein G